MTNPFTILDIDQGADKKAIMLAVSRALREGKHDAKTIAEAQKTLFHPLARAKAQFRYQADFAPYAVEAPPAPTEACPPLDRLLLPLAR
uniref:Uncharacterized protein n=1 Tax=Candidatus Kentrum sp. DK TaxID=2126562 RepID=A0A450SWN2_9GAMM|nr:MAG: hypothetical protein BECKDK2373C_GA0170839_106514 [Candidatus Kentron sp. DK]